MSKLCTKCEKAVYPLEELKCLEKIWHKSCFKCTECGMLLNMKNYKGYNKQPYCVAHYPKTKATAVAETPELARVAQNTKQQSLVKYHEEFEKKIKGSKIEVADDQETQRVMKVNAMVSQLEYRGKKSSGVAPIPANKPKVAQRQIIENATSNGDKFSPFSARTTTNSTVYTSDGSKAQRSSVVGGRIGSIADYDPMNENYGSLAKGYKPASRQNSIAGDGDEECEAISTADLVGKTDKGARAELSDAIRPVQNDPQPGETGTTNTKDDKEEEEEEEEEDIARGVLNAHVTSEVRPEVVHTGKGLSDGAIDDVEENLHGEKIGGSRGGNEATAEDVEEYHDGQCVEGQQQQQPDAEAEQNQSQSASSEIIGVDDGEGGEVITTPLPGEYVALYDYDAQDLDEVSFAEDDIVIEVEKIDDGWLLGTVAKTGMRGMLPANYVQPCRN